MGRVREFFARFRTWIAAAAAGTAVVGGGAMMLTGANYQVYVGATPTPPSTPTATATVTCDVNAANLTQLNAADDTVSSNGTVCLTSSSDYGQYSGQGSNKTFTIAVADGVSPTMRVALNNGDSNLTIDGGRQTWDDTTGLTLLNGSTINGTPGPAVNITYSLFTENQANGAGNLHIDGPSTAAIRLTHNTFTGVDAGTEASVRIDSGATNVVIEDNLCRDNHGDCWKLGGSTQTTLINNKCLRVDDNSVRNPGADIHSDCIQVNSDNARATIRGNVVDTCQQGITAFDETLDNDISHNLIVRCAGHSMTLFLDDEGSDVSHNTIVSNVGFDCNTVGSKITQYPGSGVSTTFIRNNITLPGIALGNCVPQANSNNMCSSSCGGSNISGTPTYALGAIPSSNVTLAHACLSAASVGYTGASDGSQIGVCGGDYNPATDGPPTGEGY